MKLKIVFLVLMISTSCFAGTNHFTGTIPTNNWVQFAGQLLINGMEPENGVDEVAVFIDDGNGGELMVGATTVGTTVENYYLISIFGDDTQTAQKDGALAGDLLIFKVWHDQSKTEQIIEQNQMNTETVSGLTLPDEPLVFGTVHGEQYGYLNLMFDNQAQTQNKRFAVPVLTTTGLIIWMGLLMTMSVYILRKRLQKT